MLQRIQSHRYLYYNPPVTSEFKHDEGENVPEYTPMTASQYYAKRYRLFLSYELQRFCLDVLMLPLSLSKTLAFSPMSTFPLELFKQVNNMFHIFIPFWHYNNSIFWNYITLNKYIPDDYLTNENIMNKLQKENKEQNLVPNYCNQYIEYVLVKIEEDLLSANSKYKIPAYYLLSKLDTWIKNKEGISDEFLRSLKTFEFEKEQLYFRKRIRYRMMPNPLLYGFIVINDIIPTTPLTHSFNKWLNWSEEDASNTIFRFELVSIVEKQIKMLEKGPDYPLLKFNIIRSVPITLSSFLYSMKFINKRNMLKIKRIKLYFDKKENIRKRMHKSSDVKPVEKVEAEDIKTQFSESLKDQQTTEGLRVMIMDLNFLLNRLETRTDISKEVSLLKFNLNGKIDTLDKLLKDLESAQPNEKQKITDIIEETSNDISKYKMRLEDLRDNSKTNLDNIIKEISYFKTKTEKIHL